MTVGEWPNKKNIESINLTRKVNIFRLWRGKALRHKFVKNFRLFSLYAMQWKITTIVIWSLKNNPWGIILEQPFLCPFMQEIGTQQYIGTPSATKGRILSSTCIFNISKKCSLSLPIISFYKDVRCTMTKSSNLLVASKYITYKKFLKLK